MTVPFSAGAHLRGRLVGRRAVSLRVQPRAMVVCLVLAAIVAAAGVVMLTTGTLHLSVGEVWDALTGGGTRTSRKVVLDIRLPRLVTGVFVGACCGTSGAVFQSISRNVLGSPDIVGFTAGAATGAIVQILVFDRGPLATALAAVGGGIGAALVVAVLASDGGTAVGYRLVLVGIGVGAVLGAVNALLLTRSDPDEAVTAHNWLVGSLNARTWEQAVPVMVVAIVGVPLLALLGRSLDLMEMGDDIGRQLGVAVARTRRWALIGGVSTIAVATAAAGPIAFVALAAPQLVRRLARTSGTPVVSAAFMGAALLVVADLLAQRLPVALKVPVGLMTGLLGGVYLILLLGRAVES